MGERLGAMPDYISVDIRRFTRLLHPKMVSLVVALREDGKPNAMPASWVMPASVEPPLLVVAVSPRRYTYDLIQRRPEFTVNPVPLKMRGVVEYLGSVSGRDVDKLAHARLGLLQPVAVSTPCLEDALACIECSVWAQYPCGDHYLIVGRVRAARVRRDAWTGSLYDLSAAEPLLHLGGDEYATASREPRGKERGEG